MVTKFCKKCLEYIRSTSAKATLFLLILLTILKHIINDENFISGITTEFAGIIVTINFVQVMFDNENEKSLQKNELDSIKKFNKILEIHIGKYIENFYELTTPFEKRDFKCIHMSQTFKMSDMKDLYAESRNINNGLNTSCIELFFEIELNLRNYIVSFLVNNELKYNNEIEELLLKFVKVSMDFDSRKSLLDIIIRKEFPTVEDIPNLLINLGDEFYENIENKKNANLLFSYAYLYIMLKEERDIINKYQAIIKSF